MTSAVISETAVHVYTVVCNPDLLMRVDISDIVVHGSDVTVETATVETAMPSASVPSARVGKIRLEKDSCAQ